jgi:hypothetical protein
MMIFRTLICFLSALNETRWYNLPMESQTELEDSWDLAFFIHLTFESQKMGS